MRKPEVQEWISRLEERLNIPKRWSIWETVREVGETERAKLQRDMLRAEDFYYLQRFLDKGCFWWLKKGMEHQKSLCDGQDLFHLILTSNPSSNLCSIFLSCIISFNIPTNSLNSLFLISSSSNPLIFPFDSFFFFLTNWKSDSAFSSSL